MRGKTYLDFIFLGLIGLLICLSIFRYFNDNFLLTVNTYLGFLSWLVVVIIKLRYPDKSKFYLAGLLILSTLNIISFTAEYWTFGSNNLIEYNGIYFSFLSLNPLSFLLFIIYAIFNGYTIKDLFNRLLKKSEVEVEEEYEKLLKFYYEKFVSCSVEELEGINRNFKDYPMEAQKAIEMVMEERKINL
jgi:hypothetical protein